MIKLHISQPKVLVDPWLILIGASPCLAPQENKHVIFTGNGYSAEWPIEANKRGLPNLNTTPRLRSAGGGKTKSTLPWIHIYTVHIYIYIWQSSQDWLIPNLLIGERTNLKSNLWLFLGVTPPIDSQDSFIQGGHYTCNNIHLYNMNNTEHAPTRKGMRKLPRTADIRFLQRRTAVSKNDL